MKLAIVSCVRKRGDADAMLLSFPTGVAHYQVADCRSIAEGYNQALAALPDTEIFIFVHDDVRYWGSRPLFDEAVKVAAKEGTGFVGVAGRITPLSTSGQWWDDPKNLRGSVAHDRLHGGTLQMDVYGPYGEVQVLDGVLLMCHRRVFDKIGKFDESLGWHFYDLDITQRAHKAGLKNYALPLPILHQGLGALTDEWQASHNLLVSKNTETPVRTMTLVGLCRTKNNRAIVEPFVRHHLKLLDHLLICDNGSVDDTPEILGKLAAEDNRLAVSHDTRFGDFQTEHYADLARAADQFHPTYLIPLDCDEFLGVHDRQSLERALQRIPAGGKGTMWWRTFVITPDTLQACADDPPSGFQWRRKNESPLQGKAIIRCEGSTLGYRWGPGNHDAYRAEGKPMPLANLGNELPLLHFPIACREQLLAKSVVHWMAFLVRDRRARNLGDDGWQSRRNFDGIIESKGKITDQQLCKMSQHYCFDLENKGLVPSLISENHGINYERKYSNGQSMDALALIAKTWEQSLTGGQ